MKLKQPQTIQDFENLKLDLTKYSKLNKTVTFNGRKFNLYSKETKRGVRYFYYSTLCMRMFPIAKKHVSI